MPDLARSTKQIGAVIRRHRKRLGLNQNELGERTGLRQATISQIENGKPGSQIDTILAILAALDLEFQIGDRRHGIDIRELID
ncbi:helix-turn-helix domain-containing protein [Luteibacter anthropi]|uniref:Helix-turn-helix domain-containing protein n=1 Tax=Luteibacter anthropi TaxID=564369 RepID=A0A7X5U752_9GAMM|nr:helix-turn-helix domain-containing protein [Luteibacter anthropi]NII05143.1 helix-turn-helix domain-containing protein [Luteibacter anthropi]URX63954.1 helix-turn-helix domain-containing protein [Luteibacter anthropi]